MTGCAGRNTAMLKVCVALITGEPLSLAMMLIVFVTPP